MQDPCKGLWKSVSPSDAVPVRRIHIDQQDAADAIARAIQRHVADIRGSRDLVVICIGTDRSTGDALGPLTGSMLANRELPVAGIYGTLDEPVHATNLSDTLEMVAKRHPGTTTVAVDACLGRTDTVGTVCVRSGPLQPGTGVHKKLPSVGHFHITGVVNVGGFMEYFVLQNTRLSLVMRMADRICEGVSLALSGDRRLGITLDWAPELAGEVPVDVTAK